MHITPPLSFPEPGRVSSRVSLISASWPKRPSSHASCWPAGRTIQSSRPGALPATTQNPIVRSEGMRRFLESHHLRLIAQVARTESVTRAADLLDVTQSAVSHQLRELEDKLGTPLFVRSGRRMLLTPAGRLLVETADEVL